MYGNFPMGYGHQGIGYISPPVLTFNPSPREDEEDEPDENDFHHEEDNFLSFVLIFHLYLFVL